MQAMLPAPTIFACYGHAWRQIRQYFWLLLGITVAWFLIKSVGGVLLELVGGDSVTASLLNLAYSVCVGIPLLYGGWYVYLRRVRGDAPEFIDLFAAFRQGYSPSIVSGSLVIILSADGLLLFIVPGIIIAVRLSFVPFLVVGEQLGPIAAINESWRRTRGYFWTILGLSLVAIPILLVGVVLSIMGVGLSTIWFGLSNANPILLAFLVLPAVGEIPAMMWFGLSNATLFAAITARRNAEA